MCGIAGILTASENKGLQNRIEWMQTALLHRGPDDRGIYISPDQRTALAHTRLAILDLSPAGHQPMSSEDGRYWITFNGEIYNFRSLRTQLEREGERFQTQTDTEVILKLYQKSGPACVKQLRGMFAFAIWDQQEQTCFLARDPLGIKPLYYWQSGSMLVFASELKAVLASRLPSIEMSPKGLYGYLTTGSVPEPDTLVENVYCLQAGHWLLWQTGEVRQEQYWQIDFTPKLIDLPEARQQVREALVDSIQHHFVSDVPVGVFLSGGIDSTALVALARQTQTGALKTYSIAFEEPDWNEGEIAEKVAHIFGTEHHEQVMTAATARSLFSKFLQTIDQPSVDGFNSFCVSQIAHQDGTKVVLSGLGGDELFGGYGSFQKVPQMVRLGQKLSLIHPIAKAIGVGIEHFVNAPRAKRLGDFLQQASTSNSAYLSFRGVFSHSEACRILSYYLPAQPTPARQRTHSLERLPTLEDETSWLEMSHYMRNQLLRDSDVMSMAWGLELRIPFVDQKFIETTVCIPSQFRLMAGKQLLTQAIPELPNWVVNRPKRGFSFPFQKWLEQDWNEWFQPVTLKKISLDLWYRRWSLMILQHRWHQVSHN